MASDSLSILDIQEGLIECLAAREEAATPEEVSTADVAISAYLEAEVAKVDGIARAVRQWQAMAAADKAEASRLRDRSAALEGRVARLKEFVRFAMEKRGVRRIEGKLSTLRLQAAGGKQGVEISNEALLPDEYCWVTVKFSGAWWSSHREHLLDIGAEIASESREPNKSAIAEALLQPCPTCGGRTVVRYEDTPDPDNPPVCSTCGGSGKQGVPGASLRPRGDVVVIA
jgi:hypothetical protein